MADGYDVVSSGGRATVPGGGSGLARSWLEQLQAATAGATGAAAAVRRPRRRRDDPARRPRRRRPGARRPVPTWWPACCPPPTAPRDRLAGRRLPRPRHPRRAGPRRRHQRGPGRPGAARHHRPQLHARPAAGRLSSASGPVAALLADPVLADLLAPRRPRPPGRPSRPQRVVAETAMITAELPGSGTARTVVAMPPRRWNPRRVPRPAASRSAARPGRAPVSLRDAGRRTAARRSTAARLRYPRRRARPRAARAATCARWTSSGQASRLRRHPHRPGRGSCPGWSPRCCGWSRRWWRGRDGSPRHQVRPRAVATWSTCAPGPRPARAASRSAASPARSRSPSSTT